MVYMQKQKYRGMFETQKSGDKTSSGEIGLNIRTLASPKVGQDQVSGEVSVLCWHVKGNKCNQGFHVIPDTFTVIQGLRVIPGHFSDNVKSPKCHVLHVVRGRK